MQIKYIKKLLNENSIKDFEKLTDILLPQDFCNFVKNNNGGRPEKQRFYTCGAKERSVKSLLSFNKEDKENIFVCYDEKFFGYLAPIAIDNFGNLICFSKDSKVYFWNHEDENIEFIANSFSEFLQMLY